MMSKPVLCNGQRIEVGSFWNLLGYVRKILDMIGDMDLDFADLMKVIELLKDMEWSIQGVVKTIQAVLDILKPDNDIVISATKK